MENQPKPLPVSLIREVKNYSIVWFGHSTIATSDFFLVDKVNRKIWMYQMNHPAKDVTGQMTRRHETDKDKDWTKQRIGIYLYKLMVNQDVPLRYVKVIEHSDSAIEITAKIHEARLLQAELFVKICKSPTLWATDEAAAAHFGSI